MQDPTEQAAYEQRKVDRAAKKRASSKFDYETAGGFYIPTQAQYDHACKMVGSNNDILSSACNIVIYGYTCNERISHDYIHEINESIRNN
jgi:hypothetical protein